MEQAGHLAHDCKILLDTREEDLGCDVNHKSVSSVGIRTCSQTKDQMSEGTCGDPIVKTRRRFKQLLYRIVDASL